MDKSTDTMSHTESAKQLIQLHLQQQLLRSSSSFHEFYYGITTILFGAVIFPA